jgi:glycosyltransferase involved in cell wall biosynthesis
MKIAIAHDSFTQMGGAERVVDALHELFPDAPVFTLVFDPKFKEKYKGWDIRTSNLQSVYLAVGSLQYCLPLIPYGVDTLDFSGYDLIISSSSGFVKNLKKPKNAEHICYCHSPARFLWVDKDYIKQEVPFYGRPFVNLILNRMKKWDFEGAQRVTKFIANSQEVRGRIKKYYNRESEVVYPFIDTTFWKPIEQKKDYFLIAGRLQAHKKNDLIIEIFNELGLPLHIVGTGRQETYLKSIAKPNIKFLGHVTDEQLRAEYSSALGFIYPQEEDFGLMPLEAAACATATIAYKKGGALETIVAGETGEFFDSYDKDKIKQIILNWNPEKYKTDILINQAKRFSKEEFKKKILANIN